MYLFYLFSIHTNKSSVFQINPVPCFLFVHIVLYQHFLTVRFDFLVLFSIELEQEISNAQSRYIRHSLKNSAHAVSSRPASPERSLASHPSVPPKIANWYTEIHRLADEKVQLAQHIVNLLSRKRARLDADLAKIGYLQENYPEPKYNPKLALLPPTGSVSNERTSISHISESLISALPDLLPASAAYTGPSVNKSKIHFSLVFVYLRWLSLRTISVLHPCRTTSNLCDLYKITESGPTQCFPHTILRTFAFVSADPSTAQGR